MMCCKLPAVDVLGKPGGVWCKEARPGKGCSIYGQRPQVCRDFQCMYLLDQNLGPEWQPSVCKFILYMMPDNKLAVLTDTGYPNAWRDRKYYPSLKQLAATLLDRGCITIVMSGATRFVMLPDRDERIDVPQDARIEVHSIITDRGPKYEVSTSF